QVKPQEYTYYKDLEQLKETGDFEKIKDQIAGLLGLAIYRLDFIATIKTGNNEYKKVLIEIQKAKNPIDLMRFRNYLGEQYKKEDEIETDNGKEKTVLPIITIYLLGFKLQEIETPAVKVNCQYFDLISKQIIPQKSDFIEKLTHDCYVVQISRIKGKLQNRLEQMLSVFEQDFFVDEKGIIKEYNYEIIDENIKNMLALLHKTGTDPKERQEIEKEQEAYRILELTAKAKTKELEEIIKEKDKVLEEKNKEIAELKRLLNKR
ncbi:MAG: hypothetical protein HY958_06175, partial [Bacteroidia bacterium]|nr:hypothetical protein [Bacteroidia bacterium]